MISSNPNKKHLKVSIDRIYLLFWSINSVLLTIAIIHVVIQPIWYNLELHIPGEPNNKVDFLTPVDTIFYVRNAELGYNWNEFQPTSIWFHPLIPWLIIILPATISFVWRVYLISIVSATISLVFIGLYVKQIFNFSFNPCLLLLVPLVPGGLNLAVGNAELTSLAFNSLLLVIILRNSSMFAAFLVGVLAILTKPNALYMLAPLVSYCVYGLIIRDKKLVGHCVAGLTGIISGWVYWILYVDIRTGGLGTYWHARQVAMVPLYEGPTTLLYRTIEATLSQDLGLVLKFASAIIVPVVDLWLILLMPFRREIDRIAAILGVISMLAISFATNNPNKIIVYALTIPIHIPIYLTTLALIKEKIRSKHRILYITLGFFLIIYCIMAFAFFVFGTPLAWYY